MLSGLKYDFWGVAFCSQIWSKIVRLAVNTKLIKDKMTTKGIRDLMSFNLTEKLDRHFELGESFDITHDIS